MSSEQFKHIQKIRQTYRDDSELSKTNQINLIKIIAEDLNNTDAHFIFELIQNAEDNKYVEPVPYISFRLTKTDPTYTGGSEGALIVENNEVGFNHNDVDAICAAAQSPKKKRDKYIGEKGIGFKSVFRVTENPHIFSKGYHFCLPESDEETGLGYIVPQWIDIPPKGLDLSKTHIILPLNKSEFGYNEIEKMLLDIEPETILFLSKLQEVRIKTDTGTDLTILKNDSTKPKAEILIEGEKQDQSFSVVNDFLVCTQTFHKPTHIHQEKREDIEKRDVSIAFQLDEDSMRLGKIFAYLPVKPIDFPFLVNADFILTSSRQDIHRDSPWNHWLIDCMANVIATKLLPLLKERELLSVDFLNTLLSKFNDIHEKEKHLYLPVFGTLRETFINEELLPAHDGTFVSGQNAKLVDSEGLIDLLNPDQLSFLFQKTGITKWLVPDITERRTQKLWKYLRDELKIDAVDPEMFARRIDKRFLEQQSDGWFIDFYKFLSAGSRPPKFLWTLDRPGILRSKPILRLQDKSLVNPDSRNVYLSEGTDSETASGLVKVEISQDEDAHKFLRELEIPEWDLVAEVIEHILPKYWNNPSSISMAEYERDSSKIVSAYATDSQEKKDQLLEKLLTTSFILTEKSHAREQIYLKPNQLCFGADGRIWSDNFTGTYSSVSVSEEICEFLRALDIPKWDIVDEVIKTILPKYKQNPPRVSIKEHTNDFTKITLAYETDNQYKKMQLKTELQATHFILAENPSADFPIYLKPDHLYFPTDELRMYFENYSLAGWVKTWENDDRDLADLWREFVCTPLEEPPIAGAFVNLDRYPNTARTLFADLDVTNTVRVKRRRKDNRGRVKIIDRHSNHRRGLEGFDPDIYIDGLEFVIESITPGKSAFIWNEIARPNADCIRGTIEKSRNQQYIDSESIEEVSKHFGCLLIDRAWLPDSDGNMHRPSEITLAELPEEFARDEQLANQLRVKKDEVAELAEKSGVSIEAIRNLIENPEEYKEYKAWKAERTKEDQPVPPEQENTELETVYSKIDYQSELEKSFNKTGQTIVQPHIIDDGKVMNPKRRREKIAEEHRDRLNKEPSADDRRRETYRTLLEGPDPQVREYLSQMYGGKCQICDHTFPERDGKPFFVANYIVERQKSAVVDTSANALCLCADHFAKFKHGAVETEGVLTYIENFQTESEGENCRPILDIKLCGEKCEIRFKEKHLLDLQELIKVSSED